jgi:shikimate dehydrogenase
LAGVIGHPIRHSLSPLVLNAAFAAAGLDWAYLAFDVAPGDGAAAVEAMRALGIGGLSVTMPHKDQVATAVDRLTDDAAALGAVNCVFWDGDQLVGDSTDGAGFLDALRAEIGWEPAGKRCLVAGAGGAARSIIRALGASGAADVAVANRTAAKAEAAAALAGPVGRVAGADDIAPADLVVNATSVGMGSPPGAHGPVPLDVAQLGPHQVVVDAVYVPRRTPLLAAAADRGAVTVDGVGMLVHQAGHAFRRWTGDEPPLEAMAAAARAHLDG